MPLNETDVKQDHPSPAELPEATGGGRPQAHLPSAKVRAGKADEEFPPEIRRRKWWLRWATNPRTVLRTILMLDDTPHSIALGTAVGVFVGMTPTVGVQMILVMIFAFLTSRLFQFNRVAALLTVYISNPLTVVPIYWIDYKVGTMLFGGGRFSRRDFAAALDFKGLEGWWQTIKTLFIEVGEPLILGSLVVGAVLAAATYPAMLWVLRKLRRQGAV